MVVKSVLSVCTNEVHNTNFKNGCNRWRAGGAEEAGEAGAQFVAVIDQIGITGGSHV